MIRRLLACLALALAPAAAADTLIDNVQGIAFDEDGAIERFDALLIGDDGRVLARYSGGDEPPRTEFRQDGGGAVLIPGLVDAHLHVMGLGFGALTLDLSQTASLDEALAAIRAFAAANPERPWLVGRGWNQEQWGSPLSHRRRTRRGGARPAGLLERVDGHAVWANTIAIEAAGIGAETADPAAAGSSALPGRAAPRACSSTRRARCSPTSFRRPKRPIGIARWPRRRRHCWRSASPRSPIWAAQSRTGRRFAARAMPERSAFVSWPTARARADRADRRVRPDAVALRRPG